MISCQISEELVVTVANLHKVQVFRRKRLKPNKGLNDVGGGTTDVVLALRNRRRKLRAPSLPSSSSSSSLFSLTTPHHITFSAFFHRILHLSQPLGSSSSTSHLSHKHLPHAYPPSHHTNNHQQWFPRFSISACAPSRSAEAAPTRLPQIVAYYLTVLLDSPHHGYRRQHHRRCLQGQPISHQLRHVCSYLRDAVTVLLDSHRLQ